MPLDRCGSEAPFEAVQKLAGQRDFREHDQGLPAGFERARDSLEIDFRLARAGNAIEQSDGEILRIDGADQRLDSACLVENKFCRRVERLRVRKCAFRDCNFNEAYPPQPDRQ